MSERVLRTLAAARSETRDRQHAVAAGMRLELAERDAALSALRAEQERAMQHMRETRGRGHGEDVLGLRAAAEYLRALRLQVVRVARRVAEAEAARAELLARLSAGELSLREAAVGARAVGVVLEDRARHEQKRRELSEDEERDDLARTSRR